MYVLFELECEKNEIIQQEAGISTFKKTYYNKVSYLIYLREDVNLSFIFVLLGEWGGLFPHPFLPTFLHMMKKQQYFKNVRLAHRRLRQNYFHLRSQFLFFFFFPWDGKSEISFST